MHAGTALLGYAAFSTFGLLWCIDDAVASGLSERAVHHINKDWLAKCAASAASRVHLHPILALAEWSACRVTYSHGISGLVLDQHVTV